MWTVTENILRYANSAYWYLTRLDLEYVRMHAMWDRLINQLQRVRHISALRTSIFVDPAMW